MGTVVKDLGAVTAYAYAVSKGYTGTEDEFAELMASYATVAESAAASAAAAGASATLAEQAKVDAAQSATNASTSASTATTKASEAAQSATSASGSASTATTKASEASASATAAAGSATTASTKAGEASTSATNAVTAKTAAQAAQTAAETAQGKAEDAQDAAEDAAEAAQAYANAYLAAFPVDTASGAIASFPDGADNVPVSDLTVAIDPVQTGSGDPSPDNIRPISGWTGANVTRTGKNLLDTKSGKSTTTSAGITAVKNADGSYNVEGTASGVVNLWLRGGWGNTTPIMKLYAGRTYYIKDVTPYSGTAELSNTVNIGGSTTYTPSNDVFVTGIRATTPNGTTLNTVIHPYIGLVPYAEWQPFGDTYSITFPSEAGTVYGGTLNVTTGALTVTHGNIASYAGETLPGEWISDRDVYVAGTTPSTGAQVVYELATPQTYQLTPTEVRTLLGTNNIWADTGDCTVEYRADTTLYVDKKIAALAAAMN